MDTSSNDVTGKEILQHLKSIESRISKLESYLDLPPSETEEEFEEGPIVQKKKNKTDEELEFRIGQYWFAKLGISVFLIGWIFANTLPFEYLNQVIPVAIGFLAGMFVIATSFFLKKRFPHIAGYTLGSGFVIIYLAVIRLHFFSPDPVLSQLIPVIVILYLVSLLLIFSGVKWNSPYITALGFSATLLSALIGNYSYLIFFSIIFVTILSSNFKIKYSWSGLFNFAITLAYLVHLIWFINNPLIGNSLELKIDEPLNLLFILIYQIIFSFAYFADKKYDEYLPTAISILANTSIGYGLYLLITILSMPTLGQIYHLLVAFVFLGFAILFFTKKQSKIATFYYAMTGYAALSVGIILQFDKPDYFMWLCWQSLIVVSTAVWFRSKFIIVANFFIFLLIFLVFLVISGTTSGISLSFGIVALLSARILNWKKDQLELQTEQMRNAYLVAALLIIPYSLYHMMPSEYVAFSWVGIAIIYYLLSVLLKNTKYRYMSIATYLMTVLYVLVIGITSEETASKILSFLVVGAALIILSIIYARNKNKASSQKESTN
jgi:hypothetical protein